MGIDAINQTNANFNLSDIEKETASLSKELKAFVKTTDELDGLDSFVSTTKTNDNKETEQKQEISAADYTFETAKEVENFIKKCEEEIGKIIDQIEANEAEIEKLETERAQKQADFDKLKAQQEANQVQLKSLKSAQNNTKATLEDIQAAIENASKELKLNLENDKRVETAKAIHDYDEEKDGDYNEFLQNRLKDVVPDAGVQLIIKSLTGQGENLSANITRLNADITTKSAQGKSLEEQMQILNDEIDGIDNQINIKAAENETLNNTAFEKQALESKAVLASVSSAEKDLAKQNNLDLTETFDDGTPKYFIAPGKEDGKLHIYERDGKDKCTATSLARKYGGANGPASGSLVKKYNGGGNGRLKGTDIVKLGNGYMKITKDDLPSNGKKGLSVYNFTQLDDCLTSGQMDIGKKEYCTYSPLSFDLNGDGVRTSNKLIKYDIDGDGILDTINDSADAVLVFDKDGDGISGEDGSEAFGNYTDLDGDGKADGYKNGFEALKALAKKENLINGKDDNSLDEKDLKLLEEKYGLKIKTGGYNSKASSLFDSGISRIDFSTSDETHLEKNFDGKQNDLMTQDGATFIVNGKKRKYADIWHSKK